MKPLSWEEYYSNFNTWAESTREKYVSRLVSVGTPDEVAVIVNSTYTERIASKLLNMALDSGLRFTAQNIALMQYSVDADALVRAKKTENKRAERKTRKKAKRQEFWEASGEIMIVGIAAKTLTGKKK